VHPFSLREKARMREYEIKQLSLIDPLSPTLSRWRLSQKIFVLP